MTSRYNVTQYSIPFLSYTTWVRVTTPRSGKCVRPPLIVLHGGPGIPHDYCLPMVALCDDQRAVIHYDQIGCGRSSRLPDAPAEFWTVELFVDELRNLVDHLGLMGGYHLLGQSWGGMLGPEYVLRHPERVLSMILADSPASMPLWATGTEQLLSQLPADVQATIRQHEAAGTTDSEAYQQAAAKFYQRHVCRVHPYPDVLENSFARLAEDPTVYHTMVGPSEFSSVGTLRNWSVVERLPQIAVPSLVLAGEFDEATPISWEPFVRHIPSVEHHVFRGASHTPHLETPVEFFQVVSDFLKKHDGIKA
ncbi:MULTISPECIES: proline iminopeptidase-family hydrolase [unclassified Rhizobium]|uniref:proline iminopeptidase-family hydrolase n=1 Tax=unclassified Rhizobium TaxID=2613769 RepID=UPI0007142809|nr:MULTISPECIES: proline iminopeptidase-family hydrolase [unclassified Rhizobium]KQT04785.1 amino acid amidase [Rhizobium sp. Leaf386]KQT05149.1 amino acid amidase [Rhizobium sp. Leaf391]KQU02141.1 amino acid amidase [Rhizobium sp. Leaf453]